jgi:hypothetical protein
VIFYKDFIIYIHHLTLLEKSNEWVGLGEQTREKINEI